MQVFSRPLSRELSGCGLVNCHHLQLQTSNSSVTCLSSTSLGVAPQKANLLLANIAATGRGKVEGVCEALQQSYARD